MAKNKIILKTKKDTVLFAGRFAKSLQQANSFPVTNGQLKSPQPPFAKGGLCVVALVGELGVGKTFFTKALGKALGVKETIKSPSFNLMKIYEISGRRNVETSPSVDGLVSTRRSAQKIKTLIHVDCYRLNSPEELVDIGLLDYFEYNNTLIMIEWADKIKKILPKNAIWIKFEMGKNGARTATIN